MEGIELSESDLRDAFADALDIEEYEVDQDAKTAAELREMFNTSETGMARRIKEAVADGRLEAVRKRITAADGRSWLVSAYRTVGER